MVMMVALTAFVSMRISIDKNPLVFGRVFAKLRHFVMLCGFAADFVGGHKLNRAFFVALKTLLDR